MFRRKATGIYYKNEEVIRSAKDLAEFMISFIAAEDGFYKQYSSVKVVDGKMITTISVYNVVTKNTDPAAEIIIAQDDSVDFFEAQVNVFELETLNHIKAKMMSERLLEA